MKAKATDATMINANVVPVLLSLETGTFPYRTTADTALSFTLYNTANLTPRRREKIVSLYKKTRVEERYFAIPDFLNEGGRTLLQRHRLVSLNDRLEQAGNTVLPLVTNVAKRALDAAEVNVDDVGQLVVVTSTALGSPGLEGKLVRCLGLRSNVLRACINYMGCGAGILGLRWASDFVKGLDSDRSDLVSLLICVEASSVHSTMAENQNSLVTHSLFSDGVACAVVRACSPSMPGVTGKLAVLDFESFMLEATDDGIRLQMNADGIECLLSPRLPEAIESGVRLWLDSLLQRHRTKQEELSFWAIHPGGPKIIEKALEGLDLPEEAARFSWETLRGYGNTLSCGVFYVLKKMLDGNAINPGDRGLAFSFSPGVSVEGVLLHALPAPSCQAQRERLKVKERRGAVIPSWVPDEIIERLGALDQRPDDVFVVTYPKAGTTWMLQIVHLLTNGGEQGVLPLNRAVGWIERDGIAVLKAMPSPRIIKTHLPLPLLVPTEGRWIYVARNPKDLAVSYYYHARAKVDFDFLGTWDRFFELFLEGQVEGGDWWEHTAAGIKLARQNPEDILCVWYEMMRYAPLAAIRHIASFLATDTDADFLQEVARKSSLDQMRRSPLANVRWTDERLGEAPHLRKGSVGDWQELFTLGQEAALEEKWYRGAALLGVAIPKSPDDLASIIVPVSRQVAAPPDKPDFVGWAARPLRI